MKRLFCLAALACAIGCTPRLDLNETIPIAPGSAQQRILPAVRQAQKIKIDVQATGSPVDVFVYLEKNKDAAQKEIYANGGPNLLAAKKKIDSAQFEVSIPPAESTVIDIMPGLKKATVVLKATN
jgi:hypothetical protein